MHCTLPFKNKLFTRFFLAAIISAVSFFTVDSTASAYPVLFDINENSSPVFPASTRLPDQGYVLKDDTNYKLYYAGDDFASINLATSPDGITWTPYSGNPVLQDQTVNPTPPPPMTPLQAEHADVHFYSAGFTGANSGTNPSAITMYYRMWYQGVVGGIANWRYAESPDGISWYNRMAVAQFGTPVFSASTGAAYGIADVVYTPGASNTGTDWMFRIYVNVQWEAGPHSSDELVIMAFSSDGYNWTGYDPTSVGYATPVFAGTLDGVSFDTDHIGWFKVIKNSDTDWQAFYSGGKGTTYQALDGIGYATSNDGINWVRRQTLFTTNDPVAWRSQSVWMPSVVKSGIDYEIFFLGSNDPMTDNSWIWWKLGAAALTPVPVLNVVKNVVNTGGGTAVPSDFTVHVKTAGVDVSGSPASGTAAPGTLYSLSAGTYAVSENANSSYTESFSGDCDSNGNITLSVGDEKTCTITNTYIPPATLYVVKTVINDNRGTKIVADFPLFVNSTSVVSGAANILLPGSYAVTETYNSQQYTQTFSSDCPGGHITLASGDSKTCTITNNDVAPRSGGGGGNKSTTPTLPAGCTSTSGYSMTTGLPCSGTSQVTFPAGCTSTSGYSVTTGLPCSGTVTVITTPVIPTLPIIPPPPACVPYMTKYIELGVANDPAEVKKLQIFLRDYESFSDLAVTGIYDQITYNNVKEFQSKYAQDILIPWGHTTPTGYVYTTTIKKINELYCQAQTKNQPSNASNVFTEPLSFGSNGPQVILLQDTLKKLGFFPQSVVSNGNFGPTTLKAVQDFQVYYNIAKPGDVGYGQVGPNTRRELNELINK